MGLLTQEDVKEIQDQLKDAEASMKSSQKSLDDNQKELTESFNELNDVGNKISAAQKVIDTETANIASYESIIVNTKLAIKDKEAEIKAGKEAGLDPSDLKQLEQENDALLDNLSSTEDKKADSQVKVADNKRAMDDFQQSYDDTKNQISDLQAEQAAIKGELADHTRNFNEYSNSTILAQFEEETKTRKEHAQSTIQNKERIRVLLEDKNDAVDDKLTEMNSDSSIFIKDIKQELEFTPAAESKLERIQSALDGTDSLFTASQAFDLASESIYSTKAIVEKIKKACYEGKTSIDLMETEISSTQLLMLDKVGYKITHRKNSKLYEQDDLVIIIDWGFASKA